MALTKGTTGNRANLEPKVSINITGPSEERVDGNGAQITIEKVDKPVPNSNVLGKYLEFIARVRVFGTKIC